MKRESTEYTTGYWCHRLGKWRQSDDYEPRKGGIFVASIRLSEEIELQAETGECCYLYTGPRALNILGAIAQ